MNYTINEIPNTATEANDADFAVLYQGDKTKKISFQNLFNKARRNNIFITATNTTIAGPKLQAGDVIRVFFIAQQEGTDTTTAMALSYNGTSYNVKAPCNGSLKDFTANAITVETRELSKGAETEEEEKGETKSTRAASTAYVYCQAYTTLELLFDGTQFVIIGNPVVISNADYTIYTDGTKIEQPSYSQWSDTGTGDASSEISKDITIPSGYKGIITIWGYWNNSSPISVEIRKQNASSRYAHTTDTSRSVACLTLSTVLKDDTYTMTWKWNARASNDYGYRLLLFKV